MILKWERWNEEEPWGEQGRGSGSQCRGSSGAIPSARALIPLEKAVWGHYCLRQGARQESCALSSEGRERDSLNNYRPLVHLPAPGSVTETLLPLGTLTQAQVSPGLAPGAEVCLCVCVGGGTKLLAQGEESPSRGCIVVLLSPVRSDAWVPAFLFSSLVLLLCDP